MTELALALSPFQERVALAPEALDLFLGGGRGGGKSTGLVALGLRHCAQHGRAARVAIIRQSFPGLVDVASLLLDLAPRAFPGASYSSQQHLWRMPNGATIELGILESSSDLVRYQGRSYTLLLVDELTEWPDLRLVDRLRATLRGGLEVPLRLCAAGNPGGVGHQEVARRFVLGREPWVPFVDERTGRTFVYCPSTYLDNPAIDQEAYARNLAAATAGDDELAKAWLAGSWAIARGAYFADSLDEQRCAIGPVTPEELRALEQPESPVDIFSTSGECIGQTTRKHAPFASAPRWRTYLSLDWGMAAPSVCLVLAVSPGCLLCGQFIPRDSIVVVDELHSAEPDSLTRGLPWTLGELSERIKAMASRWAMAAPRGWCDDALAARQANGVSIIEELRRLGVYFSPARKGSRVAGWALLRQMLSNAGQLGAAGLYIGRSCEYLWQTLPTLARDRRNPEDLDSRGPDHGADALRYGLVSADAGMAEWVHRPW